MIVLMNDEGKQAAEFLRSTSLVDFDKVVAHSIRLLTAALNEIAPDPSAEIEVPDEFVALCVRRGLAPGPLLGSFVRDALESLTSGVEPPAADPRPSQGQGL